MPFAQVYETPILHLDPFMLEGGAGRRTRVTGLQVLASPARAFESPSGVAGEIHYQPILADATQALTLDEAELTHALGLIADPMTDWHAPLEWLMSEARPDPGAIGLASYVMTTPTVPIESSPLDKRTLGEVSGLATMGGLFIFGGVPLIAFVGTGLGLVAVRGLGAVRGAIWEGARPELVEFSGDAAHAFFVFLRNRLGIPHRRETRTRSG